MRKYLAAFFAVCLLISGGVAYGQTFDITCPDGIVLATGINFLTGSQTVRVE